MIKNDESENVECLAKSTQKDIKTRGKSFFFANKRKWIIFQ